jgi:hypothetical protein
VVGILYENEPSLNEEEVSTCGEGDDPDNIKVIPTPDKGLPFESITFPKIKEYDWITSLILLF